MRKLKRFSKTKLIGAATALAFKVWTLSSLGTIDAGKFATIKRNGMAMDLR